MARASARSWSNSGSFSTAISRFTMKPRLTFRSARWSSESASALRALLVKFLPNDAILSLACPERRGDGGRFRHPGQNLGDMARPDTGAFARKAAGDLHQAAKIGREHGLGAGREDGAELRLEDRARYLRIFDREHAAE